MSRTPETLIVLEAADNLRQKRQPHFGCRILRFRAHKRVTKTTELDLLRPAGGANKEQTARQIHRPPRRCLSGTGRFRTDTSFEIFRRRNMIILICIGRFQVKVDRWATVSTLEEMLCRSSSQRTLLIEHHGSPTKIRSLSAVSPCVSENPLSFLGWLRTFSLSLPISQQRPFANPTTAANRFSRSWLRGY
jgi:hypothetical protein